MASPRFYSWWGTEGRWVDTMLKEKREPVETLKAARGEGEFVDKAHGTNGKVRGTTSPSPPITFFITTTRRLFDDVARADSSPEHLRVLQAAISLLPVPADWQRPSLAASNSHPWPWPHILLGLSSCPESCAVLPSRGVVHQSHITSRWMMDRRLTTAMAVTMMKMMMIMTMLMING